ncbi:HAMP domain-containing protein [Chitinophaga pendula]|uniref:sensor histidine kinase n=1 Tax=Chitinophaga TaxID=79328 RepID=UPI000BAFA2CF|nr:MULTISPECIES: histidine kinase dimerization/phospho-acceptor domain-containing protein [Chitinophaga]ASZ12114.1 hypothetical protein CK934_14675 [Chitinophaga sp. MD30]UCJ04848.1 HAMP domain-containing protein [Chitinophaga pendula]
MMKFSRYPGIRLKITLAFGLVFTVLSTILNIYSYQRIQALIIADNNNYLLSRAKSLLDKTEVSPVIIPLPEKNTELKIYARSYDGIKTLLFQSPGIISQIGLPQRQGVFDTLGLRIAYVASSSEDNPAELMLAISSAPLQSTLRDLLLLLLLSTLASVIIAGLVSYWLARFFLLPVQRIINTSKKINTGQLLERVPVKETNDELQELSETINAMLGRIDLSLKQQRNFFASASHELKTPLAILRAEVEVNLQKAGLGKEFKDLLKSQLEEINRLQNVVQEFLVISEIKDNKLKLRIEDIDISELILKTCRQLQPLADARKISLDIHFDEESENLNAKADKDKLRIVLLNLLENAIKYSLPNTQIKCSVVTRNDPAYISVCLINTIHAERIDLAQLTNAFYRGDLLQPGSGMGLWLSNEIITAHQGKLTFTSYNYTFKALLIIPYIYN